MSKTVVKDNTLQALLIADTFDKKLLPLGQSMSQVSLAGSTFIDYAFEFLSYTEVKEAFVLIASHFDELNEHIRRRWSKHDLLFQYTLIKCSECRSFGDVMRDVDKKALIKSDFVLLQAGLVCNADLKAAAQEHRQRRAKDKNAVITLVYAEGSFYNRSKGKDFLLATQPVSKRLKYVRYLNDDDALSSVNLPLDIFMDGDNLTLYFNLTDCNLAVCSPQIPPLFSDNFDFETRRDLIREILTNDEVLGYQAYVHILSGRMASFISDYSLYLSASFRILERFAFPLVPDLIPDGDGDVNFTWFKRNLYIHKNGVSIAKTVKLVKNVIVGQRCKIEDKVRLENVVLGDDCEIAAGTTIKDCIVWNNVKIGPRCRLNQSVLCFNVRLSEAVSLGEHCVVLNDISINANQKIDRGNLISKSKNDPLDAEFQSLPSSLSTDLLYQLKFDSDKSNCFWEEPSEFSELTDCQDEIFSANSDASCGAVGDTLPSQNQLDQQSDENNPPPSDQDEDSEEENEDSFYAVVHDIIVRGIDEHIDYANLILEINCAKPTFNVSIARFNEILVQAILELSKTKDMFNSLPSVLKQLLPVLRNYYKSDDSQFHCLYALEKYAKNNAEFLRHLQFALNFLYDNDVLTEEQILKWTSTLDRKVHAQLQNFIKWLEEAEEESSSGDDDD